MVNYLEIILEFDNGYLDLSHILRSYADKFQMWDWSYHFWCQKATNETKVTIASVRFFSLQGKMMILSKQKKKKKGEKS